ncbi:MAG: cupin domain-containing protein [bacterium]|nr:cupin domain-containing protein [bacterium]
MSNSVFISKKQIDETLKTVPTQGKRLLDPLKTFAVEQKLPLNILEDKEISNDAEVHVHEADLWHCLEGEVTFICGGEMIDPWIHKNADGTENKNEIKAKKIQDGKKIVLHPGDWLYIPAGEPHQHMCPETTRLVIIKIPQKSQVIRI